MNPALYPHLDPTLFDEALWTDRVSSDGIFAAGFATIPFAAVIDRTLSDSAFKLYSFYFGLASRGDGLVPSEDAQRELLGMSEKRFESARNQLVERGLISVDHGRVRIKAGAVA